MLLRYCSNCGTPNSVDPARIDKRTYCLACGEVLQVVPPQPASAELHTTTIIAEVVEPEPDAPPVVPISQLHGAEPTPPPQAMPAPAAAKTGAARWDYPPGASHVPPPAARAHAAPAAKAPALATAGHPAATAVASAPQRATAATTKPVEASPAPRAPAVHEEAAVEQPAATSAPRRRRFPRLHRSAGFFVSTVVHTIAFVVLSLIIISPPEMVPVMAFVSSRPAHQAEEELKVEEFQAIEVEAEVEAIAQISDEEVLDSATEVSIAEAVADTAGDSGNSAGEFTLPEGLFARVPGSGQPGIAASSASFAKRLRREKAKSGDVQISLLWNNYNDIDLHVRCPSGELISFDHRKSRCRGELDVDMNAEGRVSNEPVENIYWPAGKAPYGEYFVVVNHYRNHGDDDPTAYEVEIKVDGRVEKYTGELRYGDPPFIVHRFERIKGATGDDDFYVE